MDQVSWFEEALRCTSRREAKAWLDIEVAALARKNKIADEEAEAIIKSNLGYIAGYYDHETAQKIFRLFDAVHPVFKTADYHKTLTPDEVFKLGMAVGREMKRRELEKN